MCLQPRPPLGRFIRSTLLRCRGSDRGPQLVTRDQMKYHETDPALTTVSGQLAAHRRAPHRTSLHVVFAVGLCLVMPHSQGNLVKIR